MDLINRRLESTLLNQAGGPNTDDLQVLYDELEGVLLEQVELIKAALPVISEKLAKKVLSECLAAELEPYIEQIKQERMAMELANGKLIEDLKDMFMAMKQPIITVQTDPSPVIVNVPKRKTIKKIQYDESGRPAIIEETEVAVED